MTTDTTKLQLSIDLGDKIINTLENLARPLGLTVKELFPYYIKQVYFEAFLVFFQMY